MKAIKTLLCLLITALVYVVTSCNPEEDDNPVVPVSTDSTTNDFIPPITNCWIDTVTSVPVVMFFQISTSGEFIGVYPCTTGDNLYGKAHNWDISFKVITSSTSYNEYSGKYIDTSAAHPVMRLYRHTEGDTLIIKRFP